MLIDTICYNLLLLILCCVISFLPFANTSESQEISAEQAMDIAKDDPRVKDILTDFPRVHLIPSYNEAFHVWIIELLYSDAGEVGFVSVSPKEKSVVEFDFNVNRVKELRSEEKRDDISTDDDTWTDKRPNWLFVFSEFRPILEGPALAWFTFILTFLLIGNFQKIVSWRNCDIILIFLLCPFMNVIWATPKIAFTGIFLITCLLFLRSIGGIWIHNREANLSNITQKRILVFLLILLSLYHINKTYESGIDDSGLWSVIGSEYLLKSGHLPYGTEFGTNCVYGPLMYIFHIPVNLIFPPNITIDLENNQVELPHYEKIEMRGAQTMVVLMDLLAVLGMYFIGAKYWNSTVGLVFALLYALNPYILGMGGAFGLQQTSHITGIPFIVFALVFLSFPVTAGVLLGIGAGILYYPIFLFPLWLGFYLRKNSVYYSIKFLTSFTFVGIICLILIIYLTVPDESHTGLSPLQAFIQDTIHQQQFSEGYGKSEFSFWGQYPSLRETLKTIVTLFYIGICVGTAFILKKVRLKHLISLTATILIGTQLVLSHGGGTYIGFYIAPLLLTLFKPDDAEKKEPVKRDDETIQ